MTRHTSIPRGAWSLIVLAALLLASAVPTASAPLKLTDDLGRQVEIEEVPQRIVSLAPAHTEILFAIGANEQIAAVTDWCSYPKEAQQKPKIGGFSNPNLEAIAALRPDLVVAVPEHSTFSDVIERLEKLGITVVAYNPGTIDDVLRVIGILGEATGHPDKAQSLVSSLKSGIEEMRRRAATVKQHRKVYYEVWHDPLMSAGPGSFIDDMLQIIGAENIFADAESAWPQVNPESVVLRAPDVIVFPQHHGMDPDPRKTIPTRPGWKTIPAVANNRIVGVDGDLVARPGPRVVSALKELGAAIYPEVFQ